MSARVAKLEALLGRVQTRAAEPRPVRLAAAPAEAEAEVDELEVDEPGDDLDAPISAPVDSAPVEEMELDEIDDLDDAPVQEVDEVELDEPELDEPVLEEPDAPESGAVAATSMDDAIDAAEHQPPMTPPPESGEEIANPQIPADEGPTMGQLGETISLEEGSEENLELDEPVLEEPAPPPSRMEASIPQAKPQEDLQVPENAREELERMRLGESSSIEARVSTRPVISTNVVDLVSSSRDFEPKSFLELVDSSLALK